MNTLSTQTQEAQQIPSTKNIKKTSPGHIIIKLLQTRDKGKVLKADRKKDIQSGTKIGMSPDFLLETMQAKDNGATF